MAILLGTCHSILISGILSNTNSLSKLLPFDDIKSNLWQISINELSFKVLDNELNHLCGISCNFVTDLAFNNEKQVIKSQPILWQVLLKGSINNQVKLVFDKSWFYVTNPQEELVITLFHFENGQISTKILNIKCELYVTVLLQRVK